MKKIIIFAIIVFASCTQEEAKQEEKCFTVGITGWNPQIGYYIFDNSGKTIPTERKIQIGEVYCKD
jgi:hypothetical protein